MVVRQTSIDSYMDLRTDAEIGEKQLLVLAYIRDHPGCSDREISDGVNMRISSETARRNELMAMRLIEELGKEKDIITNRMVLTWRAR
jgi:DNA-binding MarR family transcriptional regulator